MSPLRNLILGPSVIYNEPSKTKTNSIVLSKTILPFLRRASNQFRIPFPSGGRKFPAIPQPAFALRRNIFLRLD